MYSSVILNSQLKQQEIIQWYSKNKRNLPWRSTTPWGVVVSEFMLQQTPVSRVLPIWTTWINRWPTPRDLAKVSRADVIRAWGNLGYPRRAVRLHEVSKIVVLKFGGEIPTSIKELRELPGIGDYTAAAIASFAFKKKALVLDTNVRRLFSRALDGQEFPSNHQTSSERVRASELIPRNSAIWAASTMELGAVICTARNPKCNLCPISKVCQWKKCNYPKSSIVRKRQDWHGTDRMCRGVILKALCNDALLPKSKIHRLWQDQSQLERALISLLNDGLIEKSRSYYSLFDR